MGTLQGCPGGPGSCCAPVHLLLSIELPSSDITSFPGPWINGPGPKAATHTAVAVLLGGSADSGRAQRFVRDTGSPVLSVTGLPAPRHAEKAVPAQGRRSPLPPRHWARTDPAGRRCFPIRASVTCAPSHSWLPAPAASAAQQNPAAAPPQDHAQADLGGLRHRAVSGEHAAVSPAPSSPVSGLYLMGPVTSDIWGTCFSFKGARPQPQSAWPLVLGSKRDVGLGRPGVLSKPGASQWVLLERASVLPKPLSFCAT